MVLKFYQYFFVIFEIYFFQFKNKNIYIYISLTDIFPVTAESKLLLKTNWTVLLLKLKFKYI